MTNNLDKIAKNSLYTIKTGVLMQKYTFKLIKRYFSKNNSVLELGPAEGVMTQLLVNYFDSVELLEGSSFFCEKLKKKHPEIAVHNDYFETFSCKKKYDLIILGHVLEHVNEPTIVLNNLKKLLKKGGKIFCAVPNANSLHRQAAVLMKILETETSMSEKDIHHGHKRVFQPDTFRTAFHKSLLNIEVFGGYWIKPLSDSQLHEWSEKMLNAFMKLGELYPDIAAENYIIASVENND